jgi:diacylglycerol O-acyltransferase
MQRMTGYDAAFIYDERPEEPQHTLKIAVWSPEASAAYSLDRTRTFIRSRLGQLPPLRWRVRHVPFDLYHPVWVEDRDLDLGHHVRRRTIRDPAGRNELCEEISDIASMPLDPKRPLWELWMLEGYEDDKVVAVLKMSHALADGAASKRLIEILYAPSPEDIPAWAGEGEAPPSSWTLLKDAARDRARAVTTVLPRLSRTTHAARRAFRNNPIARFYGGRRISMLHSPPTPFAGRPSKGRSFHFVTVPLAEAKDIRSDLGCTVNDIVLATTAGAVRSYLKHHRALPGLPTLVHMPASIRTRAEANDWGNRITTRPLSLPTHIADPVARLRAVSDLVGEAKQDLERRRGANVEDWLRWLPPYAAKGIGRLARAWVRMHPEFPGGISVTSVPGPATTLYAPGGPVENFISVGHVKYVAGLNVTVWSYDGKLNFGFYACSEAVPDLSRFAGEIAASFEELRKAATREAARIDPAWEDAEDTR